jgi:hypothetical protein
MKGAAIAAADIGGFRDFSVPLLPNALVFEADDVIVSGWSTIRKLAGNGPWADRSGDVRAASFGRDTVNKPSVSSPRELKVALGDIRDREREDLTEPLQRFTPCAELWRDAPA